MRLEVNGLAVRFGGLRALDDVSFRAEQHHVTGVIGPNGAGKSTLLNALTGWVRAAQGTATVGGTTLFGLQPHEVIGLGVVRSFQNLQLFDGLSVRENLAIGRHHRLRAGLIAGVVGLRSHRRDEAELRIAVDVVAERLGLAAILDRTVSDLPYGHRKKIEIARALIAEPRLLLLDEPAAGLDAHEIELLAATLCELRSDGLTIVLVEHEMGLVMALCDEIVVLDFGRVIATGSPAEIRANQTVRDAYLGSPT